MCFKCGERWGKDHICKFCNLNVVLLEASDDELEESKNDMVEEEADGALPVVELKTLRLGFNSMQGFITKNRSFKVMGRIGEKVVVLIDTGAEENFLSRGLAQQLKLTIEESPFLVEVGTRHTSRSSGIYPRVELEIQGATIVQPFS